MAGDIFAEQDLLALVTGGSEGIGLATARQLAARGAHVWLIARRQDLLEKALAELEAARCSPEQRFGYEIADVSDAYRVSSAIKRIISSVGVPHLLINSAGVAQPGYVQELDLEIFRWMMEVNYFGTVYAVKSVLPGMIARGSGFIVNISSIAGFLGVFGYTAYGASKFAVRGFSDALRAELKPLGIGVSIVFPPDTDTSQLAYENQFKPRETKAISGNARLMTPDEVAQSILRGVSRGRYIILPGTEGKLLYWLSGLVGGGVYPIMDWLIAQARRKSADGLE